MSRRSNTAWEASGWGGGGVVCAEAELAMSHEASNPKAILIMSKDDRIPSPSQFSLYEINSKSKISPD
jgi:hypothetical protein